MDQSGIRRRRRMNRRQRTYKSRRLTRTKAALARDNPAGLTREDILFFLRNLSRRHLLRARVREIRYGL